LAVKRGGLAARGRDGGEARPAFDRVADTDCERRMAMSLIDRWLLGWLRRDPPETSRFTPAPTPLERPRAFGFDDFHRLRNVDACVAAIGDIHGRIDLLRSLERQLDELSQQDRPVLEIYLGDYVDHAGDAKATLDHLIERKKRADRQVVCLAGNHERMMLQALDDVDYFSRWLKFGGDATVRSYGVPGSIALRDPAEAQSRLRAALPASHREFLERAGKFHEVDGYFFAHAGVDPVKALSEQTERDLLWIREPFLSSTVNFGKVVVHGHTPTAKPDVRRNRIGLDTGAYLTGRLSCLILTPEGMRISQT
jgi:serine/threonine protein phosphatase 1